MDHAINRADTTKPNHNFPVLDIQVCVSSDNKRAIVKKDHGS